MSIQTNASNKKPKGEIILVAKSGLATANEVDKLGNGSIIDPNQPTIMGIEDGQLGIISASHTSSVKYNDFISAGNVVDDVDIIQIVQGTPYSSNINKTASLVPIDHKEFIRSHKINGRDSVGFTAKIAKNSANNSWLIGNTPGQPGEIAILGNQNYSLNLQFHSVRNDRNFSVHGNEDLTVNFVSPDYDNLSIVDPLDHLVKNIVYNADLNSYGLNFNNPVSRRGNKNFIAFALSIPGASGTALSSITENVPFQVAVSANGLPVYFTPDKDFVETVERIIAEGTLTGASTIEIADLTSAGSAVGADSILVVSLDEQKSFAFDDVSQVKVTLKLGLEYAFKATQVRKVKLTDADEGQGKGRVWKILYDKRYALNIYSEQSRQYGTFYIKPPEYVDISLDYTAYIIEHKSDYLVQASHESNYFYRTIILVPCVDETTDSTVATSLNTYLGPWLDSTKRDYNNLEGDLSAPFI